MFLHLAEVATPFLWCQKLLLLLYVRKKVEPDDTFLHQRATLRHVLE